MRIFAAFLLLAASLHAEKFRFSILGDRTGEVQPGVYERIWREVDALHPDFVINVGDSVQSGTRAEWEQLRAILKPYSRYPFYFTPGNHDIDSPESRKLFQQFTGHPAHYSFNHKGAHFTVLDNAESDELSDSELSFLRADLEKHRSASPKFIFYHRPDWLLLAKLQNHDFPIHRLAKEFGVCCVIAGHVHVLIHAPNDGVTYLAVGSSGGHLRGPYDFEKGSIYHHTLVTVDGPNVTFTIKEVPPPGHKPHSLEIR